MFEKKEPKIDQPPFTPQKKASPNGGSPSFAKSSRTITNV
jgi:hypothetical protein